MGGGCCVGGDEGEERKKHNEKRRHWDERLSKNRRPPKNWRRNSSRSMNVHYDGRHVSLHGRRQTNGRPTKEPRTQRTATRERERESTLRKSKPNDVPVPKPTATCRAARRGHDEKWLAFDRPIVASRFVSIHHSFCLFSYALPSRRLTVRRRCRRYFTISSIFFASSNSSKARTTFALSWFGLNRIYDIDLSVNQVEVHELAS